MDNFEIKVMNFLAEVIAGDIADRVKELRYLALQELMAQLRYYKSLGIREDMICSIAEKKGKLIMEATSKFEMDKLMKPHCPHFDGNKFVPDKYNIPEEEMICWSQSSFRAPLNEVATKRYLELFEQIFPEQYNELFGKDSA